MKFYGTYELIQENVAICIKSFKDNEWFDLTFDCASGQQITISLTKEQLTNLYEVSQETIKATE